MNTTSNLKAGLSWIPCVIITTAMANAAPIAWDNGGSGLNWTVTGNWNPDGEPGTGDTATIGNFVAGHDAIANAPFTNGQVPTSVLVESGAQLLLGDNVDFSNGSLGSPLNIIVEGEVRARRAGFDDYTLTMRGGSKLLVRDGANPIGSNTQSFTLESGTTTFGEASTGLQTIRARLTGPGNLDVNLDDSTFDIAMGGTNPGFTGDLNITNGILILSRDIGTGEFMSGDITVGVDGTLSINYRTNEIMPFSDTTALVIEESGGNRGLVEFTATQFAATDDDTVESLVLGANAVPAGSYTLDFLNSTYGNFFSEALSGDFTLNVLNTAVLPQSSSIPEPSSWVLLLMIGAFVQKIRRRER